MMSRNPLSMQIDHNILPMIPPTSLPACISSQFQLSCFDGCPISPSAFSATRLLGLRRIALSQLIALCVVGAGAACAAGLLSTSLPAATVWLLAGCGCVQASSTYLGVFLASSLLCLSPIHSSPCPFIPLSSLSLLIAPAFPPPPPSPELSRPLSQLNP
eukprot:2848375-Pleurochrysis_carterae.AAC.1